MTEEERELKNLTIPANICPEVQIRKSDALNYFIRQTRINVNPSAPQYPVPTHRIVCHTPEVWNNLMKNERAAKNSTSYAKAAGCAEIKVVHDPTILSDSDRQDIQAHMDKVFYKPQIATASELEVLQKQVAEMKKQLRSKTLR